jgi:hypothetical protein
MLAHEEEAVPDLIRIPLEEVDDLEDQRGLLVEEYAPRIVGIPRRVRGERT